MSLCTRRGVVITNPRADHDPVEGRRPHAPGPISPDRRSPAGSSRRKTPTLVAPSRGGAQHRSSDNVGAKSPPDGAPDREEGVAMAVRTATKTAITATEHQGLEIACRCKPERPDTRATSHGSDRRNRDRWCDATATEAPAQAFHGLAGQVHDRGRSRRALARLPDRRHVLGRCRA